MNKNLPTIALAAKTRPVSAEIETYAFENRQMGIEETLFHRITIELEAFDSGLGYGEQQEATSIVLEWFDLGLENPRNLDGLDLCHERFPEAEGSIYLGFAHNPCRIEKLLVTRKSDCDFHLEGRVSVDFEFEGVARNEEFAFVTNAVMQTVG